MGGAWIIRVHPVVVAAKRSGGAEAIGGAVGGMTTGGVVGFRRDHEDEAGLLFERFLAFEEEV